MILKTKFSFFDIIFLLHIPYSISAADPDFPTLKTYATKILTKNWLEQPNYKLSDDDIIKVASNSDVKLLLCKEIIGDAAAIYNMFLQRALWDAGEVVVTSKAGENQSWQRLVVKQSHISDTAITKENSEKVKSVIYDLSRKKILIQLKNEDTKVNTAAMLYVFNTEQSRYDLVKRFDDISESSMSNDGEYIAIYKSHGITDNSTIDLYNTKDPHNCFKQQKMGTGERATNICLSDGGSLCSFVLTKNDSVVKSVVVWLTNSTIAFRDQQLHQIMVISGNNIQQTLSTDGKILLVTMYDNGAQNKTALIYKFKNDRYDLVRQINMPHSNFIGLNPYDNLIVTVEKIPANFWVTYECATQIKAYSVSNDTNDMKEFNYDNSTYSKNNPDKFAYIPRKVSFSGPCTIEFFAKNIYKGNEEEILFDIKTATYKKLAEYVYGTDVTNGLSVSYEPYDTENAYVSSFIKKEKFNTGLYLPEGSMIHGCTCDNRGGFVCITNDGTVLRYYRIINEWCDALKMVRTISEGSTSLQQAVALRKLANMYEEHDVVPVSVCMQEYENIIESLLEKLKKLACHILIKPKNRNCTLYLEEQKKDIMLASATELQVPDKKAFFHHFSLAYWRHTHIDPYQWYVNNIRHSFFRSDMD